MQSILYTEEYVNNEICQIWIFNSFNHLWKYGCKHIMGYIEKFLWNWKDEYSLNINIRFI